MSLINSVNLIILLENKISTTKKTIQCKKWMFINIMEIYIHNIPKTSQWFYLLTKYKLNENMIIS
jgi:hypothetical protein